MFGIWNKKPPATIPDPLVSEGGNTTGAPDLRSYARTLFSHLSPRLEEGAGLVIQFIAAKPGEGVSSIAREFAMVACQYTEGSVALLEFDGLGGGHERFFSCKRQQDRFGPLRSIDDWNIDSSALMLAPRGQPPCRMKFQAVGESSLVLGTLTGNHCEAMYTANALEFWASLRQMAVLTIVDSSSPPACLDGIAISGDMDGVVIVVAAESTRSPVVVALCEKLRQQEAPILGAILNKRRFYIPPLVYRWLDYL